jgi:hypothetical protein
MHKFLLGFLVLSLVISGKLSAQHSAYLEFNNAFFFFIPVPIAGQVQYQYQQEHWRFGGGLSYLWRSSEGRSIGIPLEVGYHVGNGSHLFAPAFSLNPAWESISELPMGEPEPFERRKFTVTPALDLFYRFQPGEAGFFLQAGPTIWTPPIVDVVLENDFIDDGKYDGIPVRLFLTIGAGWGF